MTRPAGFDEIWRAADGVEGWLTAAQARRLHDAARRLAPGATVVEIGSFRGRSAIVLARSAPEQARVVAIDPHAGTDRGPRELVTSPATGDRDHAAFRANLRRAGVADRVEHVRDLSDRAHAAVDGEVDLLFVDGAHRCSPARRDLAGWGGRVADGGHLLLHDAFNSVGVTMAQLRELVASPRWRYVGRTGSLAEYRRARVAGPARAANAVRQLLQLGYFGRNLAIKLALVARLRPLARLLGHRGDAPWPY